MKLIFDIDEELYEAYKGKPPMLGDAGMDMIAQAIANGTPYNPTGDLISREALHKTIGKIVYRRGYFSLRAIKEAIDNAPTVEPDAQDFKEEIIRMVNMGVYPEAIIEWVREQM